jgi:myo-inositol-1-phosphate synthase
MQEGVEISKASGKLGILIPGMGAVASTIMAGVYAVRNGYGKPIGSLIQMGTIRLGKRTEKRVQMIRDFLPLSDLNNVYIRRLGHL